MHTHMPHCKQQETVGKENKNKGRRIGIKHRKCKPSLSIFCCLPISSPRDELGEEGQGARIGWGMFRFQYFLHSLHFLSIAP